MLVSIQRNSEDWRSRRRDGDRKPISMVSYTLLMILAPPSRFAAPLSLGGNLGILTSPATGEWPLFPLDPRVGGKTSRLVA